MVFVNSMSDLFHKDVPESFIAHVFETMAEASQHHFQILTKRPKRMSIVVPRLVQRIGVLRNVWLGTSIENDDYTWRADWLRRTPAAIRFLSIEPLLGPVPSLDLAGINWVIVGGESGPRARSVDPAWVRDIRDRSTAAGVDFFFKQWGGRTPKAGGRALDGRTWDELPQRSACATAVPAAS
jgi:protein gp37